MRLLILTQKIDSDDPVLGFFHTWVEKLSPHFEKISVVCLEKGRYNLPSNIKVYSLGKEAGQNKLKYVSKFFVYIIGLAREYDAVFVHMNQEYVLLGGLFWKLLGKRVYLWRNHPEGSILTRIAVALSYKVFCTSPYSFTAKYKKTSLLPVGIDTDKFKVTRAQVERKQNSILFLGRMSPIKKPEILIEALSILHKEQVDFQANFYGDPLPKDKTYYASLLEKAASLGLDSKIIFHKAVANDKTPAIYSEHEIFVNLTPTGSMDKTILEATACGCIPIVSNDAYKGIFEDGMLTNGEHTDLAEKIDFWLKSSSEAKAATSGPIEGYVLEKHSLGALIEQLYVLISKS